VVHVVVVVGALGHKKCHSISLISLNGKLKEGNGTVTAVDSYKKIGVIFQVLTATGRKITAFWDIAPCSR
jgi:hypothetical protein